MTTVTTVMTIYLSSLFFAVYPPLLYGNYLIINTKGGV